MSQKEHPISSVSGVGAVFEDNFKAIGVSTDMELIRRVESVGVPKILEEIKQMRLHTLLSIRRIEKIYENAKEKHSPTLRDETKEEGITAYV